MMRIHLTTKTILAIFTSLIISGCVSSGRSIPAPVEDKGQVKSGMGGKSTQILSSGKSTPISSPPILSTKSGYYTVKQGDTLIKIGLDQGQSWRDIMKWNAIENPNLIEVGQVLRVNPPSENDEVIVKPVSAPGNFASSNTESKSAATPVNSNVNSSANSGPEQQEDHLMFSWPAQGNLLSTFDDSKNKGIDIGGKSGDAVLASADGKVVYAGTGLRGYGNLVILKHNSTFLTAYAHNQSLMVKEDQFVKRGQKIAEMGNSDSDNVKLHFEIRKLGKPVDPIKFLTSR